MKKIIGIVQDIVFPSVIGFLYFIIFLGIQNTKLSNPSIFALMIILPISLFFFIKKFKTGLYHFWHLLIGYLLLLMITFGIETWLDEPWFQYILTCFLSLFFVLPSVILMIFVAIVIAVRNIIKIIRVHKQNDV